MENCRPLVIYIFVCVWSVLEIEPFSLNYASLGYQSDVDPSVFVCVCVFASVYNTTYKLLMKQIHSVQSIFVENIDSILLLVCLEHES